LLFALLLNANHSFASRFQDDTFIICNAFAATDPTEDVVERIVQVMEEVGPSIFISTLTTVVAFLLGGVSSLPGIRWFCWYAGPTVAIDFIYQITLFVAILVYDDRRMKAGRYDCLVCVKASEPPFDGDTCHGSEDDDNETPPSSSTIKDEPPLTQRLMSRYADLLLHPISKVVVLFVFTTMLGLGVYGASQQSQKFDFTSLTPSDSFVRTVSPMLHIVFWFFCRF